MTAAIAATVLAQAASAAILTHRSCERAIAAANEACMYSTVLAPVVGVHMPRLKIGKHLVGRFAPSRVFGHALILGVCTTWFPDSRVLGHHHDAQGCQK
jgi:hypothetical protein